MHERGLYVDAKDHSEPDQVDAKVFGGWSQQRNDDEGQLEEIEKEGENEHKRVDENEKADLPAGKRSQEVFDPDVTVDAVKRKRENAGANQNEDKESRKLRG